MLEFLHFQIQKIITTNKKQNSSNLFEIKILPHWRTRAPPPPPQAHLSFSYFRGPPSNLRAPKFNRFHSSGTECPACSQYKLITNRVPYPILLYNWPFIIAGTHHRTRLISRIYSPIIMLINLCFPILYTNLYLSPDKSISYFFRLINWTAMAECDLLLQKMFPFLFLCFCSLIFLVRISGILSKSELK